MVGISTQLVNCCPQKELYCCPFTFSLTSPPPPQLNVQYIQTVCGCGKGEMGGVELCCRPDSAGVSDQIQNLQNCHTTPNKNAQ